MKRLTILLILLTGALQLHAQEKGWSGSWEVRGGLLGKKELRTYDLSASFGYNIVPLFSVGAAADFTLGHFRRDGLKTFSESGTLGARIGFNVLRSEFYYLEIVASAGNTVGGNDWKFFYGDAGVRCAVGKSKTKMVYGAGVRYYNSQKSTYKDYTRGYIAVGMKFN